MKVNTNPDGSFGVEVDLEQVIAERWDWMLGLFKKDTASSEARSWVKRQTQLALEVARSVQIVGMSNPVPLERIYQPTRLLVRNLAAVQLESRPSTPISAVMAAPSPHLSIQEFLQNRQNSVIKAGPGWGKTTFLHALFLRLLKIKEKAPFPLLFTLRQKDALDEIEGLLERLDRVKSDVRTHKLVLLVDGYDEIPTEARQRVSALLTQYTAHNCGEYFLTCRDNYDVYGLQARHVGIAPFAYEDQVEFMRAYFKTFDRPELDAAAIVEDLHNRHFGDVLGHPLLATLACIIKTDDLDVRIRSTASLIEAALNALSLRWDQSKPIRREATTPLNSVQRMNILKQLAFALPLEPVPSTTAIDLITPQLQRMSYRDVEPIDVLRELAQFYGIFVPIGTKWGFIHRSLKDYLAAQEWVESGEFSLAVKNGGIAADSRTAFAASRRPDATEVIVQLLAKPDGVPAFLEIVQNEPSFEMSPVLEAIIRFYSNHQPGEGHERGHAGWSYQQSENAMWAYLNTDLVGRTSSRFLNFIVENTGPSAGELSAAVRAYAILELRARGVKLSGKAATALRDAYPQEQFTFTVMGKGHVTVSDI